MMHWSGDWCGIKKLKFLVHENEGEAVSLKVKFVSQEQYPL